MLPLDHKTGGLEGDLGRLGKDPSAWVASAPATGGPDPAQTLGVPRVSRSAGLPAVPRGPRRAPRAGGRADGPGRSAALGSQPRGFRNRVAGVSALGRPHLCRPALDSPPCRAAAREPGVAEPPPAAATAWTPGEPQVRAPPGGPGCARGARGWRRGGRAGRRGGGRGHRPRAAGAGRGKARDSAMAAWGPGGRCEATGAPRRPTDLRDLLPRTKRRGAGGPGRAKADRGRHGGQ